MNASLRKLRRSWSDSTIGSESTFHQIAPYIGKLKSSIASSLINAFSRPGDVIFEPFAGSGVVPLEALRNGRSVIANDLNPYASVLTRAKMFPIGSLPEAMDLAKQYISRAKRQAPKVALRQTPKWVRSFFHGRTLAETISLVNMLRADKQWFLLANVLGILHHQRPGFLSHPSSHLVPYLRVKRFPKVSFPSLYQYRDIEPRLLAKLIRCYRRPTVIRPSLIREFHCEDVRTLEITTPCNVAVTSPPYMNALDYGRDNRLRLWFLGLEDPKVLDKVCPRSPAEFAVLMDALARLMNNVISQRGKAVLVVGEVRRNSVVVNTKAIVDRAFRACGWQLLEETRDLVPDVRRSRRGYAGTKREWVMVFRKR